MPPDQYVTLRTAVRHEVEINRSRFIACLFPVADEQLAREQIAALRREFHDARHLPSAFVLGPTRNQQRTSDDGEPSGTSGVPILNALTSHVCPTGRAELTDVLAVVVRYFGGVKLGAGGLVRAYGGTVAAALGNAPMIRRVRLEVLSVHLPLDSAGRLEGALRGAGMTVLEVSWPGPECDIQIGCPPREAVATRARIAEVTSGAASTTAAQGRWVDLPL